MKYKKIILSLFFIFWSNALQVYACGVSENPERIAMPEWKDFYVKVSRVQGQMLLELESVGKTIYLDTARLVLDDSLEIRPEFSNNPKIRNYNQETSAAQDPQLIETKGETKPNKSTWNSIDVSYNCINTQKPKAENLTDRLFFYVPYIHSDVQPIKLILHKQDGDLTKRFSFVIRTQTEFFPGENKLFKFEPFINKWMVFRKKALVTYFNILNNFLQTDWNLVREKFNPKTKEVEFSKWNQDLQTLKLPFRERAKDFENQNHLKNEKFTKIFSDFSTYLKNPTEFEKSTNAIPASILLDDPNQVKDMDLAKLIFKLFPKLDQHQSTLFKDPTGKIVLPSPDPKMSHPAYTLYQYLRKLSKGITPNQGKLLAQHALSYLAASPNIFWMGDQIKIKNPDNLIGHKAWFEDTKSLLPMESLCKVDDPYKELTPSSPQNKEFIWHFNLSPQVRKNQSIARVEAFSDTPVYQWEFAESKVISNFTPRQSAQNWFILVEFDKPQKSNCNITLIEKKSGSKLSGFNLLSYQNGMCQFFHISKFSTNDSTFEIHPDLTPKKISIYEANPLAFWNQKFSIINLKNNKKISSFSFFQDYQSNGIDLEPNGIYAIKVKTTNYLHYRTSILSFNFYDSSNNIIPTITQTKQLWGSNIDNVYLSKDQDQEKVFRLKLDGLWFDSPILYTPWGMDGIKSYNSKLFKTFSFCTSEKEKNPNFHISSQNFGRLSQMDFMSANSVNKDWVFSKASDDKVIGENDFPFLFGIIPPKKNPIFSPSPLNFHKLAGVDSLGLLTNIVTYARINGFLDRRNIQDLTNQNTLPTFSKKIDANLQRQLNSGSLKPYSIENDTALYRITPEDIRKYSTEIADLRDLQPGDFLFGWEYGEPQVAIITGVKENPKDRSDVRVVAINQASSQAIWSTWGSKDNVLGFTNFPQNYHAFRLLQAPPEEGFVDFIRDIMGGATLAQYYVSSKPEDGLNTSYILPFQSFLDHLKLLNESQAFGAKATKADLEVLRNIFDDDFLTRKEHYEEDLDRIIHAAQIFCENSHFLKKDALDATIPARQMAMDALGTPKTIQEKEIYIHDFLYPLDDPLMAFYQTNYLAQATVLRKSTGGTSGPVVKESYSFKTTRLYEEVSKFKTAKSAQVAVVRGGTQELIQITRARFGHTFDNHGQHATDFLLNRSRAMGKPNGQFLDDQAAARFIYENLDKLSNGAVSLPIPKGFPARVVMPDGTFAPATKIRLVPGGKGVSTAYPEL